MERLELCGNDLVGVRNVDKPALKEGFHIIAPWNKVYIYNIKQQEEFESGMRVLSSKWP